MEITVVGASVLGASATCPKCDLVLYPPTPNSCGRCAYDIENTIEVESLDVATNDNRGSKEFCDLMQILNNWCAGYLRLIGEYGVDWSLPHEFLQEFAEHMVIYVGRLSELGYATPERMRLIGSTVTDCLIQLINAIEKEEGLMRLMGKWDEKEEEIKRYWEEEIGKSFKSLGATSVAKISTES